MNENDIDIHELMGKALAELLADDEGVIIHHDGEIWAVYKNSVDQTISVMPIDDPTAPHGSLIWIQYEGSSESESEFDDVVIGDNQLIH
jgi:hypothetical protein